MQRLFNFKNRNHIPVFSVFEWNPWNLDSGPEFQGGVIQRSLHFSVIHSICIFQFSTCICLLCMKPTSVSTNCMEKTEIEVFECRSRCKTEINKYRLKNPSENVTSYVWNNYLFFSVWKKQESKWGLVSLSASFN